MNNLKTKDLCERCVYGCYKDLYGARACVCQCSMYSASGCKCNSIRYNTPCPHFKEDNDATETEV